MPRNALTVNALRLAERIDTLTASPDMNASQRALLRLLAAGNDPSVALPLGVDVPALLAKLRRRGDRRSLLYVVR